MTIERTTKEEAEDELRLMRIYSWSDAHEVAIALMRRIMDLEKAKAKAEEAD